MKDTVRGVGAAVSAGRSRVGDSVGRPGSVWSVSLIGT
jgi:hypothetical protein